jgi:hypothetical protein
VILSKKILIVVMMGLAMMWAMNGCKSKDKEAKHRTLQGTVAMVSAANNTVAMNWYSEKLGKSIPVSGKIIPETEIYIDGKLADINQLKENDEVIVEGYKKGTDVIALKVMVTRTAANGSQTIQKPTTQPAN